MSMPSIPSMPGWLIKVLSIQHVLIDLNLDICLRLFTFIFFFLFDSLSVFGMSLLLRNSHVQELTHQSDFLLKKHSEHRLVRKLSLNPLIIKKRLQNQNPSPVQEASHTLDVSDLLTKGTGSPLLLSHPHIP